MLLHVPAACRMIDWVLDVLMLAALYAWAGCVVWALGRRMAGLPSCPLAEMGTWQWWQRWCRGAPMCLLEQYVEGSE